MRGRGPGPRDRELFAESRVSILRSAVADLSWLLTRGYSDRAALKLVGDRHALTERQRMAVSRSACSDAARESRRARRVARVDGERVHVDGFNALIVLESALSGGLVLIGRDGVHRDLASVHGTWRRVARTDEAIEAMARALAPAREVLVLLDRPVSNSGRLAARMREIAAAGGWPWQVELVASPDRDLAASDAIEERSEVTAGAGVPSRREATNVIVATGDARILDACTRWVDVPAMALAARREPAWIVDLSA